MARSPLFGRRIHIAGSVVRDLNIAPADEVARAREFIPALVRGLMRRGATFVVPVDAEDTRSDGQPLCFDWLIWQAIKESLGDRRGIARYGHAYAPLDEARARVVIDCSGRPYLQFEAVMPEPVIGLDFAASLVEEFWRALVVNAGLTVHIDLLRARNSHHAAEAIFKAGALALHHATRRSGDPAEVPSTKGVLQ